MAIHAYENNLPPAYPPTYPLAYSLYRESVFVVIKGKD